MNSQPNFSFQDINHSISSHGAYKSVSSSSTYTNPMKDGTENGSANPSAKRKRNLPGNPDPEAEVIALSPKSLLATNRFVCEVCNKGFQRDQNLQLHKRGHNLPWKLKQRSNNEIVKKKVYLCPEPSCIHHDPSRALGDLTGVKKHFSRKHGEKKWKCEKCSKRYAVQSDWKAHSKICGTREYRCDCGTLFSRRDSFITHRAFCDALAEESLRALTVTNPLQQQQAMNMHRINSHCYIKTEEDSIMAPWLPLPPSQTSSISSPLQFSSSNPNNPSATLSHLHSPHMSATALLQKAVQIGVTMSRKHSPSPAPRETVQYGSHQGHMSENTAGSVMGTLSSCDKAAAHANGFTQEAKNAAAAAADQSSFLHDMMMNPLYSSSGLDDGSLTFTGMLNNPNRANNRNIHGEKPTTRHEVGGGADDSLTRDFLGLNEFSHNEFLNMVSFDNINNNTSSYKQLNQNQTPWECN